MNRGYQKRAYRESTRFDVDAKIREAEEQQYWAMIFRAAVHDEGLREMLNQVRLYYRMKYDNEEYSKQKR